MKWGWKEKPMKRVFPFLALFEYSWTSSPVAFLRCALQVRVILIKIVLPHVLVCLLAELQGGDCNKTIALMVITTLLCWPHRGIRHRRIFTKNTAWGRMNLRGTGKECSIKTKGLSVPLTAFRVVIAFQWFPDSCKRPQELSCVAVTCVNGFHVMLCVKCVLAPCPLRATLLLWDSGGFVSLAFMFCNFRKRCW